MDEAESHQRFILVLVIAVVSLIRRGSACRIAHDIGRRWATPSDFGRSRPIGGARSPQSVGRYTALVIDKCKLSIYD
ncbi:MAG: hypothetical protein ACK4PN_04330 [Allorhizobium sp.]